ncbi:kinase-like domain-containing protein, partial [Podospora aff. communis PSN243]
MASAQRHSIPVPADLESASMSPSLMGQGEGEEDPLDKLLRSRALKGPRNTTFLPLQLLLSILTQERLKRELNQSRYRKKKWSAERIEELVNIIRPHPDDVKPESAQDKAGYIRVFALLLLMGKEGKIEDFIKNEESDHIFPVEKPDPNGNLRRFSATKEAPELMASTRWRQADREYFFTQQWELRPAYFDFANVKETYKFASSIVLPWVQPNGAESQALGGSSEREGAHGIVTQVEIDPGSHSFRSVLEEVKISERRVFALKTLHKGVPGVDGFERELGHLRRFNGKVHPHIITLLASFEHDGASYFIFPWAESTLETYWEKTMPSNNNTHPTQLDPQTAAWVAKQLQGITGAIEAIHAPRPHHLEPGKEGFGRHSDLKPDNILWFRHDDDPKGLLVVTDLGLATFNREVSRSIQPGSSARVPGYRAPECDMQNAKARRLTDIWTLGCIYLEFVTWLLGGDQLLGEFKEQRTSLDHLSRVRSNLFFEFEEDRSRGGSEKRKGQMRVKKTVAEFIARLHRRENCSQFVHEVLDVIQNEMMVVDQQKRSDASKLLKKFKDLSTNCKGIDQVYATRG